MSRASQTRKTAPAPLGIAGWATVVVFVFVFVVSLVPFDFFGWGASSTAGTFFVRRSLPDELPDVFANLVLYIPLAAPAYLSLRRRSAALTSAFMTFVGAMALSVVFEFVQAFSPSRVSSLVDVTANGVGAILGISIAESMRYAVPGWTRKIQAEFQARPHAVWVKLYVCGLVAAAAMPFTFAMDGGKLYRNIRSTRLVPFEALVQERDAMIEARLAGHHQEALLAKTRVMKTISRYFAEGVSFAFLAAIMVSALRGECGFGRIHTVAIATWGGSWLALGLSVLQWPNLHRGFDATDIVMRLLGLVFGLATFSLRLGRQDRLKRDDAAATNLPIRFAGLAVAAYILWNGLSPFVFDFPNQTESWTEVIWAWKAVFVTRYDRLADDVLERMGAFGLFGGLLTASFASLRSRTLRGRICVTVPAAAVLAAIVEAGQFFIPTRVPSIWHVFFAGGGSLLGVACHGVLRSSLLEGVSVPESEKGRPGSLEDSRPSLSPEEMFASLSTPRADSPREPSVRDARSRSDPSRIQWEE